MNAHRYPFIALRGVSVSCCLLGRWSSLQFFVLVNICQALLLRCRISCIATEKKALSVFPYTTSQPMPSMDLTEVNAVKVLFSLSWSPSVRKLLY